jgi:hypothetical protein
LAPDFETESIARGESAREIVRAQDEGMSACVREDPFESLRSRLDEFEFSLLFGAAAVRLIPVAVVFEPATSMTCEAPMRRLVKGTGEIVRTIDDAMGLAFRILRWPVEGLLAASYQNGSKRVLETDFENGFEIRGFDFHPDFRLDFRLDIDANRSL